MMNVRVVDSKRPTIGRRPRRDQKGRFRWWACAIAAGMAFGALGCSNHASPQQSNASGDGAAERGPIAVALDQSPAQIYAAHCASCHGSTGEGNGPAAYLLYPKPRDLTSGVYRFKSTPPDDPASKSDIVRTIRQGVERTAMPAFGQLLNDRQLDELASYVLGLNTDPAVAARALEAQSMAIPPQPEMTEQLVAEGARAYAAIGCGACHGATGRGDGPSSFSLRDSQGYPLPPADFSTGVYKAGREDQSLYEAIAAGIPGTPMPSFAASLGDDTSIEGVSSDTQVIWALVAYLRSLETPREAAGVRSGATVTAVRAASDAMFDDPGHADWARVEPTALSLQPLWQRRHAARAVQVRAVHDGERVALLLEWPDATADAVTASVHQFTDAGALMFSLAPGLPTLTMGSSEDSAASVNIWHWRADRQVHADERALRDVPSIEPGVPSDYYVGKRGDPAVGPITEHDPLYVPAWQAGNPKSDPALLDRAVLESNAAGFGTLTLQTAGSQHVGGRGVWMHGSWRVVLTRSLKAAETADVDLASGRRIALAAATWDGSSGDRNGTKLISGWHWLTIDTH